MTTICIIGLGYVGLPLAKAFAEHFRVIGYDCDSKKVSLLQSLDSMEVTDNPNRIKKANIIIIAVPTPILPNKEPDLSYITDATRTVGNNLKYGTTVVLESTVYPGVTEDIVIPILELESGLVCKRDFKVGYSPERINPGDIEHSLEKVTKIIAGIDQETTNILTSVYTKITDVYLAKDIKTAETAKVIENIQRDLNIALVNELSMLFRKLGLDTDAVLRAAETKWNWHKYRPGLVGGHCIPVDPYYLLHKIKEVGFKSKVITAGRQTNDDMPIYLARLINDVIDKSAGASILFSGLTYKENVSDIRESPARKIVRLLPEHTCYGYDPIISVKQISFLGLIPVRAIDRSFDCVVVLGMHRESILIDPRICKVLIDINGHYCREKVEEVGVKYCCL